MGQALKVGKIRCGEYLMVSYQCDQMVENKVAPIFLKFQKVATAVFTESDVFQNSLKIHQTFELIFVRKFVAKNFQKSPNLVTL